MLMPDDVLEKGEVEAYEYKTVATPSTKQESRMQTLPSFSTIFVTFCERLIIVFNAR